MRCLNLICWTDGGCGKLRRPRRGYPKLGIPGKFFQQGPSCIATVSKQLPPKSYVPKAGMRVCSKLSRPSRMAENPAESVESRSAIASRPELIFQLGPKLDWAPSWIFSRVLPSAATHPKMAWLEISLRKIPQPKGKFPRAESKIASGYYSELSISYKKSVAFSSL